MGTLITAAPLGTQTRSLPRLPRNRAARYGASLCGIAIVLLFYRPWVTASLAGVGSTPLSGAELARGDASRRVDQALFGSATGARPAASAGMTAAPSAGVVVSGGLVMPTRVPTVGPGAAAGAFTAGQAPPPSTPAPSTRAAGSDLVVPGAGGLVMPTRVPTVAAGTTGEFTSGRTVPQEAATAAVPAAPVAAPSPAAAAAPTALPQFSLYFVLIAGIGLAIFPIAWEYQLTPRDRRFGTLWLFVLSYGGTLWTGSLVRTVLDAPPDNSLVGRGVGGVTTSEPALWALLAAFAAAAALVTLAWRSRPPPLRDPYRSRSPGGGGAA